MNLDEFRIDKSSINGPFIHFPFWRQRMKSSADDVTFNALISAFEKGRQWQLALHILSVPWKRTESASCLFI